MQIGIHPLIQAPVPLGAAPPPAPGAPGEAAGDRVELSPAAQALSGPLGVAAGEAAGKTDADPDRPQDSAAAQQNGHDSKGAKGPGEELSEEEQTQVKELKARDREVKAHEQAHLAAAGPYARGGPSYEYQRGPDGKRYAIGGEVSIDTAPVANDPEATIRKAQVIKRAATAPAEPSDQDRRVAAEAAQMEAAARREMAEIRREEASGASGDDAQADAVAAAGPLAPAAPASEAPSPPAAGDGSTDSRATAPSSVPPTPYDRPRESAGGLLDIVA